MNLLAIVYLLLYLFWLLLIARIVIEIVTSFARDWHPSGFVAVLLEIVFTITDPPVKLFRRIIPSLNLGTVRLDIATMVLLFLVFIVMQIVGSQASAAALG